MLTQVLDLGNIPFGRPHRFTVVVKNSSQQPVVIKSIIVGCTSCTKATTPVNVIPAGEYANVDIVYTPGALGPSYKRVSVIYGDNKELKLEFKANVHE